MANLEKLIQVLKESNDPDLIELSKRLTSAKEDSITEAELDLENAAKYCMTVSVDTDMDFYIDNGDSYSVDFFDSDRDKLIEKYVHHFINEVKYNFDNASDSWKKNAESFKENYILASVDILKGSDGYSTGGNWELDITITPPLPDTTFIDKDKGVLNIFGMKFK